MSERERRRRRLRRARNAGAGARRRCCRAPGYEVAAAPDRTRVRHPRRGRRCGLRCAGVAPDGRVQRRGLHRRRPRRERARPGLRRERARAREHGAGRRRARAPRSSTTRPTSCSTASASAPTTSSIRRRRRGSTRARRWRATSGWPPRDPRHFIVRVGCLYGTAGATSRRRSCAACAPARPMRADRERRRLADLGAGGGARSSAALASTEHYGLYHCTSQGETSWADFARSWPPSWACPRDRVQGAADLGAAHEGPAPAARRSSTTACCAGAASTRMSTWQDGAARAFIVRERGSA